MERQSTYLCCQQGNIGGFFRAREMLLSVGEKLIFAQTQPGHVLLQLARKISVNQA